MNEDITIANPHNEAQTSAHFAYDSKIANISRLRCCLKVY